MKCVMVINQELPLGLIANTAAVLAMSIGREVDGIVGEDVCDQDGTLHRGITQANISILKGDNQLIRDLREKVLRLENGNGQKGDDQASDHLYFVDFCDVAQRSKHYEDYRALLAQTPAEKLNYLGIALYGPPKLVNRLTGSIGLLS